MAYNFTTKPTTVGSATFPGETTTGLTDSNNVLIDSQRRIRPDYIPKTEQLQTALNARLVPASGGELMTAIPDYSGNNHPLTQESENNRPTYQENTVARKLPSFRMDGQNSYANTHFETIRQPYTIALLFEIREFPSGSNQHYIFRDPNNSVRFGIKDDGTGKVQWMLEAGASQITAGELTQSEYVVNITFNGSSSTLRANGSSVTISTSPGAENIQGFQLSSSSNGASVDVAETLVYRNDMSGNNTLIESYLDRDTSLVPAP